MQPGQADEHPQLLGAQAGKHLDGMVLVAKPLLLALEEPVERRLLLVTVTAGKHLLGRERELAVERPLIRMAMDRQMVVEHLRPVVRCMVSNLKLDLHGSVNICGTSVKLMFAAVR